MAIPFPRQVATFNRLVGNRILGPITWWLPGFGRIEHRGRVSGRNHQAPMLGFRSADGRWITFALTYGPDAAWVRNALAAGELGWLTRRDGHVRLVGPRVIHDPTRSVVPRLVRVPLAILRVADFLVAEVASANPPDQAGTAAR